MDAVVSLHWRYVMFGLIFVNLIYVDLILKISVPLAGINSAWVVFLFKVLLKFHNKTQKIVSTCLMYSHV